MSFMHIFFEAKKIPSHEGCFLIRELKKMETLLTAHELHHYALAPSFSTAIAFHFFLPPSVESTPYVARWRYEHDM